MLKVIIGNYKNITDAGLIYTLPSALKLLDMHIKAIASMLTTITLNVECYELTIHCRSKMETVQKCALIEQHWNIRSRLNIEEILPFINQKCMLTDDELYRLEDTNRTRAERINLLIRIIPNKGDDWWNKFLWCLNESSTHPGLSAHKELVTLLVDELHKQQQSNKVSKLILK